jgi:sialate O-acetylesterase
MKKLVCAILILLLSVSIAYNQQSDIRLPKIFSDNMVLQRGSNIPIWGWAYPGEHITANLGNYSAETVTAADGKWKLFFGPIEAGGPYQLVISGKNAIIINNVLIGEVWVCSGQSNMEMPVDSVATWYSGVHNYKEEISKANYPQIRLFKESRIVSEKPQDDCEGLWSQCSPASVSDFSAVAYFFGRKLYHELGIPVGIIDASNGGTNIEAWMSKEVLESEAGFRPYLDEFRKLMDDYPKLLKVYEQRMAIHQKEVEEAKAAGKPVPWRGPMPPAGPGDRNTPSGLYNGMIAPLMHSCITGVIWYQGENNTGNPHLYEKLFPALIKNWRHNWSQGDFPFYYVQLAGFNTKQTWWGGGSKNWVLLREAQLKTLSVPNTGMAVASDVGDANDTHMKNKQEVGRRLALIALAKTYHCNIICSGPSYKSMDIEGNRIILHFENADSELTSGDGEEIKGFTISGEDKKFYNAIAVVHGDIIEVSCKEVMKPVAVRYSWKDYPDANLCNKEGLPASQFRTDNWDE